MNAIEEIIKLNSDIARLNQLLMEARRTGGGGGGGASSFLDLTDTPTSYSGQAEKTLRVKSAENGLEFINRITTFLNLSDTPGSYSGQAGKYVRVNPTATALEFSDASAINADRVDGFHASDFILKPWFKKWLGFLPYGTNVSPCFCGVSYNLSGATAVYDNTSWLRFNSTSTLNDYRYVRTSAATLHRQGNVIFDAIIRTYTSIAGMAIYVDLNSSNHGYNIPSGTAHMGFEYESGISGNWYYRTQDGGGGISTGSLGVAVNSSTVYKMRMVSRYNDGYVDFYINNILRASINTTLPPATTPMYATVMVVTRVSGASRYIEFGCLFCEINGE